ncbi:75f263bd-0c41-4447-adb7-fd4572dc1f07 [Sclerotinia trifoliorum]|uniref:75f263bd-0c41-4447-adb7-fd4572dc1f07 n=1 Tax=Sclerotinia trifoliorum TaxID=28548 RepID=A0A8H2ZKM0_9HELO|nr:75f263bd-0c41-4447-adb7-fd4572dc1f07 [Sclerotinia trifoliorum]
MAHSNAWSTKNNPPSVKSSRPKSSNKDKVKTSRTKSNLPGHQTEDTSPSLPQDCDYSFERTSEYAANPIDPNPEYKYWSAKESMDAHRAEMRIKDGRLVNLLDTVRPLKIIGQDCATFYPYIAPEQYEYHTHETSVEDVNQSCLTLELFVTPVMHIAMVNTEADYTPENNFSPQWIRDCCLPNFHVARKACLSPESNAAYDSA